MKSIADVSQILSGGTPRKNVPEYWGGNIPWFSAANMHEKYLERSDINLTAAGLSNGSRIAPKGSTLLLVRGSGLFNYIPICFAKADIAFNQDVKAFLPDEHTDPLFFHYWLESIRSHLMENLGVTGIGAGKFDTDFLRNLPFPDLPKYKQVKIGQIAALCDQKIELNRRMAVTLEEMARSLYRSWFVDFDPVHAKLERRQPAFMDEETAALFPDRFGEDGLPEGWEMRRLGDIVTLNYGKALKKEARQPGKYPVYGSGGTDSTHINPLVTHSTVVVGRKGTVGSIHWAPKGCWPIDTAYFVTTAFPMVYALRTLQELPLSEMNTDAAVPGLNRENAYRLEVPFPGEPVIAAFAERADAIQRKIDGNVQENQTLAILRDTLLPKLMSGEIRVGDAREQIEEVA